MAKSPGRSAFTGVQIAVTGPPTFTCKTAALTTSITSVVHLVVLSDIVALTELVESYKSLFFLAYAYALITTYIMHKWFYTGSKMLELTFFNTKKTFRQKNFGLHRLSSFFTIFTLLT